MSTVFRPAPRIARASGWFMPLPIDGGASSVAKKSLDVPPP